MNGTMDKQAELFQEELLEALQEELKIARKVSANDRSNEAIDGINISSRSKSNTYEFEELTGFPPEEGVQVTLTIDEKQIKGKYLGERNSKYLFEIEENLGQKITKAIVISDPLFLLEKQIEILKKDYPFKNDLALSSIGLKEFPSAKKIVLNDSFSEGLNNAQAETIDVVAKNSVTYIWGPPGTGKTTTLGSVVAALASENKKVLLVSNTNLALDTALEKCLDKSKSSGKLTGGQMLRMGTMIKPELITKYGEIIDLEVIFEKATLPLKTELSKISSTLQKDKDKIDDLKDEYKLYERYNSIIDSPKNIENEIIQLKTSNEELEKEIKNFEKSLKILNDELEISKSKNSISRVMNKIRKPNHIQTEIREVLNSKEKRSQNLKENINKLYKLTQKKSDIESELKKAKNWLKNNPDSSKLKSKIDKNIDELNSKEVRIEFLQKEISQMQNKILEEAKVIACTAYKPLLDSKISTIKFDCVVIDEASMIPLPLYFCNAILAESKIVIAGDFRQLPPIVRLGSSRSYSGNSEINDQKLRQVLISNPFTKSDVMNKNNRKSTNSRLIALRDQYRMRTNISNIVSETFYPEHPLRTVNDQKNKPTPWGNEDFLFFDTTELEPESSPINGKSRRNPMHALTVQAIVKKLVEDGWEFDSMAKKSFGIVTPYAKQADFIEKLIKSEYEDNYIKGGISTVHRFQGNERDLMIIDLTKVSTPVEKNLGSFIGNPSPLHPDNAMWNVAISRARQHIILVADRNTLESNSNSLISQLYFKMKTNMKVINAKTLFNEDLFKRFTEGKKSTKGSFSWFTGQTFYKNFENDLKDAKKKVLMASPFISSEATNFWLPILENLKAFDVKMTLLTKPLNEISNSEEPRKILKDLESIFNEIRPISRMHEKLAIIDDRIVWLGSLNILSHVSATEIMVRIDSEEFAENISLEYLTNRKYNNPMWQDKNPTGKKLKVGDKCDRPGCGGTMQLKPAGVSQRTGKPYKAFLSCDNWRSNGCKNAADYEE